MIRTTGTLAFCSILLILGSVVEAGSAADVSSRKFDEFYGANWEDAMARLDNFALELRNNPSAEGIIFVYGGQRHRRGEARAWSACIKNYLVTRRGIDAKKLFMISGGYRANLTVELWSAPAGALIPKPIPDIKPQNVRFKGRPFKGWRSLCSSP